MKHSEIAGIEDLNINFVYMIKEGLFYHMYERSAYVFYTRVAKHKISRKESKTLGRDLFYLGFPVQSFEKYRDKFLNVTPMENEVGYICTLRRPIDIKEYEIWRNDMEVMFASEAMKSANTRTIENTPVYGTAFSSMKTLLQLSQHFSKNIQNPLGLHLKSCAYSYCYAVKRLYDTSGQARYDLCLSAIDTINEILFMLQILCDLHEISKKSYSLISEQLISVSKQLSLLARKANLAEK